MMLRTSDSWAIHENRGRRAAGAACLIASIGLGGCGGQSALTGEPTLYGVDRRTGVLLDRDIWPAPDKDDLSVQVPPTSGDVVTITLDTVFLKHLREHGNPHVLVYAEVFPDGSDDPASAYTKILFEQENQPDDVFLGLSDRILFGPAVYSGFPIRIKLYIVELDRNDKEKAGRVLDQIGVLASAAPTQAQLPISLALDVAKWLNELNEDDYELRFDLTLHPQSPHGTYLAPWIDAKSPEMTRQGQLYSINTPLRDGSYLIVKRELMERYARVRAHTTSGSSNGSTNRAPKEAVAWDYPYPHYPIERIWDHEAEAIYTEGPFVVQGARLYQLVERLFHYDYIGPRHKEWVVPRGGPEPARWQEREVEEAWIAWRDGPNKGFSDRMHKGSRIEIRDQTYVVLSASLGVSGSPALATDKLRSDSDLAMARLRELLDSDPSRDASEQLSAVVSTAGQIFEMRRLAAQIGSRVGGDPQLRSSPDYMLMWIRALQVPEGVPDSITVRNQVARNAAVLEVLSSNIVNLPLIDGDHAPSIAALRSLNAKSFDETFKDKPGRFKLKPDGLDGILRASEANNTDNTNDTEIPSEPESDTP